MQRIGNRVAELVAQPMGKKEREYGADALEERDPGLLCRRRDHRSQGHQDRLRRRAQGRDPALILEKGQRADGRATDEIRPIW